VGVEEADSPIFADHAVNLVSGGRDQPYPLARPPRPRRHLPRLGRYDRTVGCVLARTTRRVRSAHQS
jgi:hypothetical protein